MAAHESPRTTKLYNRAGDEITLDEVERIRIEGRPYARAHIVSEYDEFIVGQTFETVNPLILSVVKLALIMAPATPAVHVPVRRA